jgi:hypothetical protein
MRVRENVMGLTKEFLEKSIPCENVLVLFDEKVVPNTVTKRVCLIIAAQKKGLVIDALNNIGVIAVDVREDAYHNEMWYPHKEIGLLRKFEAEKLVENGLLTDPAAVKVYNAVVMAQKDKSKTASVSILEVLTVAKSYIERFPIPAAELELGV